MSRFPTTIALIATATTFAFTAHVVHAQLILPDGRRSDFVKDYTVDFAIPDAPAFKLLQVDESAILRPQTVRDITLALDGFRGNNNAIVIPRQFGIEVSPGLLIGTGNLKIADYNAKKFLYSTRFSGATGRDSLNRGQLAAGLRLSFVDDQDLRSNSNDTVVTQVTAKMLAVYLAARKRVGPDAPLVLDESEKNSLKALSDSIRDHWADRYWNATSVEVAFAVRALTADSSGHDPKVDEVAGWLTYANGMKGWGQFLFGTKVGTAREPDGTFHSSNTISARIYIGSNVLKGFVEGQEASSSPVDPKWLVNSGVELRLQGIGWLNASAGYAAGVDGEKPRVISSFKFKTAFPGI